MFEVWFLIGEHRLRIFCQSKLVHEKNYPQVHEDLAPVQLKVPAVTVFGPYLLILKDCRPYLLILKDCLLRFQLQIRQAEEEV